jgi:hypothetical protein
MQCTIESLEGRALFSASASAAVFAPTTTASARLVLAPPVAPNLYLYQSILNHNGPDRGWAVAQPTSLLTRLRPI